jgi:Helix-turn-helix domain
LPATELTTPTTTIGVIAAASTTAPITDPFELLTLEDVAARLKFTRRQCYELTRRRGSSLDHPPLPYFKVNGNIRVLRTDFEAWVKTLAAKKRMQ